MEKYMNDIKDEIDKFFSSFENNDLYKNYISSLNQLRKNKEITQLISKIKRLQKIYVNEKDENVLKQLNELEKKLHNYPLYETYNDLKENLYDELNISKNMLDMYFNEILNIDLKKQ